ncbi:MAG: hypothetical protein NZ879_00125 [Archaeoglobaceae archaeon]|nr:hypothetical protein [Archaeoglobaceae archaeon]MDW8117377.1 hypothetical protein [Archaeoglobaceae archaeon]
MDVKETLILSLTIWAVICCLATTSVEIFITLLLIGTLIIYEVGSYYIPKEVKKTLNSIIYIMLLAFSFIVIKKAMEVLK